jgi:amino-acid N-acetyltransferase
MQLRPATASDAGRVEILLTESQLPTAGVRDAIARFHVALDGAVLVGAIGVEDCGPRYGLLRSAVVSSTHRGSGVGRKLVEQALAGARARRLEALYLLTTTAEKYFPMFGFAAIPRDQVPPEIKATHEFREACPDTATVMMVHLG